MKNNKECVVAGKVLTINGRSRYGDSIQLAGQTEVFAGGPELARIVLRENGEFHSRRNPAGAIR